jgi:hypothetical protein
MRPYEWPNEVIFELGAVMDFVKQLQRNISSDFRERVVVSEE